MLRSLAILDNEKLNFVFVQILMSSTFYWVIPTRVVELSLHSNTYEIAFMKIILCSELPVSGSKVESLTRERKIVFVQASVPLF